MAKKSNASPTSFFAAVAVPAAGVGAGAAFGAESTPARNAVISSALNAAPPLLDGGAATFPLAGAPLLPDVGPKNAANASADDTYYHIPMSSSPSSISYQLQARDVLCHNVAFV